MKQLLMTQEEYDQDMRTNRGVGFSEGFANLLNGLAQEVEGRDMRWSGDLKSNPQLQLVLKFIWEKRDKK
jgi:hypothetical protein